MFRNLHTRTKLFILCSTFILAIGMTIYSLVVEKKIAIDFARDELVGNDSLTIIRNISAAVLTGQSLAPHLSEGKLSFPGQPAGNRANLQTAEQEKALAAALGALQEDQSAGRKTGTRVLDALAGAQALASRIGDDSKLTLDPDLDSYYLQNIVVTRLPTFAAQLGDIQTWLRDDFGSGAASTQGKAHVLALDRLLRATGDGIQKDLTASFRGADVRLRQAVDAPFAALAANVTSYLNAVGATMADGEMKAAGLVHLETLYSKTADSIIKAWDVAQAELKRLLEARIDGLVSKRNASLLITGILVGLSILVAIMTHQYIVRPLQQLESVAQQVRETRNYNLRIGYNSDDEIGHLAAAFDSMLSELATARKREMSDQLELARVSRLTTMGEMTGSIAHEVRQPLTAIVTNSNAALRWLAMQPEPDIEEARAALQRIARDGLRASEVLASIRSMFKQDQNEKAAVEINDLIREVLALVQGELQRHHVAVNLALTWPLPQVMANRIQLQQVVLNLVMNAVEAMSTVAGRECVLQINSSAPPPGDLVIKVKDSGTGIDSDSAKRIFQPFFTTKSDGMGMGLSICRTIVEAHGGQLTAEPGQPYGSVFRVVLPIAGAASA